MGEKEILRKEGVKLLGVFVDSELRFKEQAAGAIGKGQAWLSQSKVIPNYRRGGSGACS